MSCSCSVGLGNLGLPNCVPMNEIPVGFLFQKTYNSAGVRNSLLGSSISTADYLNDLVNDSDESVRLFPMQDIAEGVSERADSVFYTDSLGVNHFIKEGERTYIGEKVTGATPLLVKKAQTFQCNQMSVYVLGHKGGIFGDSTAEGVLNGFEIVRGSLDVRFVMMSASKSAHLPIMFTLADTIEDGNIKKFESEDVTDNAKQLGGLLDVNAVITNESTTTATATIKMEYGTAKSLTLVEGLVVADFVLAELTPTPATITITSVTETSAGVYDIVFPTETSADVLNLTLSSTGYGKGYDLNTASITIP